eukprot:5971514-Alexandrium_andersonii.AAC.1
MEHVKICKATKEAKPTKDSLKDWSGACDTIARKLKGVLASKEVDTKSLKGLLGEAAKAQNKVAELLKNKTFFLGK